MEQPLELHIGLADFAIHTPLMQYRFRATLADAKKWHRGVQQALQERGLDTAGKKPELAARLLLAFGASPLATSADGTRPRGGRAEARNVVRAVLDARRLRALSTEAGPGAPALIHTPKIATPRCGAGTH